MIIELPSFEPNVWTYFHYEYYGQIFYLLVHFDNEVLTLNFITYSEGIDEVSYEEIMIEVLDDNSFIVKRWMIGYDVQRTMVSYDEAIIIDGEVVKSSSISFLMENTQETYDIIEVNIMVLDFINEYAFIGRIDFDSPHVNENEVASLSAVYFVTNDLEITKSSAEILLEYARVIAEHNQQLGDEFIDLMNNFH